MNTKIKSLNMIKQQLRTNEILDERVLDLFQNIDRSDFLPAEMKNFAYSDIHISLPQNACMMTPLEEAKIIQALALNGSETILEIGTGSGFLTALLGQMAKKVISVEYYQELTTAAKEHLSKYPHDKIELITGDGVSGWPQSAPYDVIVFGAALEQLTKTHLLQLKPEGKIFAIIGKAPVMQGVLFHYQSNTPCVEQILFETELPSMITPFESKAFVF